MTERPGHRDRASGVRRPTASLRRSTVVAFLLAAVAAVSTPAPIAVPPAGAREPAPRPVDPVAARSPASSLAPGGGARAAAAPDPQLTTGLDGVVALSPPDTCLAVAIDGGVVYRHAADRPMVPASTQKLVTAAVALHELGPDHRSRTTVVAGAPAVAGVVEGDLTLVGGGDSLLTTNAYAFVRRMGPEHHLTSLDALADRVVESGVTHVRGRVVGDESRYDQVRTVAAWPERYISQDQIGPLSALTVDDGFVLDLPEPGTDEPVRRERSADPAFDAARVFTELLVDRGITVDALPAAGVAPAAATEITAIESAPLTDVVAQLLEQSDNGTAELLTKEIGLAGSGAGSTAAGVDVIEATAAELGYPMEGAEVVDGSGLALENRATCDELVGLLDASGGIDGSIGTALPVAAEEGTLRNRFEGTPAAGRLRAKTGTLNTVTALAGFVALPAGGTATFAYIANGTKDDQIMRGQEFLGTLLGGYEPSCPEPAMTTFVVPVSPYLAQVGALGAVPVQLVLVPGSVVPLDSFEAHAGQLVDACLAAAPALALALP